ncbi:prepilin-type N-terminal cleavage/methylation domain-containing protein, partial [Deinococcus oregonensis]
MNARAASGVTLIEVLVTMLLVGVISVTILSSMSSTFSMNQTSERRIEAVLIAQEQMDVVKRLDPASLPSSGSKQDKVTVRGREYDVTLRYCATAAYCLNNNRHVAIDVRYGGKVMFTGETVFTDIVRVLKKAVWSALLAP